MQSALAGEHTHPSPGSETQTPVAPVPVEGKCYGDSNSASCQYIVKTYSIAPAITTSAGLRFNKGKENVLFRNYEGLVGPLFISNQSTQDIFVPQATENEFISFLKAAPSIHTDIKYAASPASYLAKPTYNCGAGTVYQPSNMTVSLPSLRDSGEDGNPIVLDGYTKLTDAQASDPSLLKIVEGSTIPSSSIAFTLRNSNNEVFVEAQSVSFHGKKTRSELVNSRFEIWPLYSWDTTQVALTKKLYKKTGTSTFTQVTSCTPTAAPTSTGLSLPWTCYTVKHKNGLSSSGSSGSYAVDFAHLGSPACIPACASTAESYRQQGWTVTTAQCIKK